MAVVNWVYKADTPTENADIVQDSLGAAHRLRNKFCELELLKRERYYEILRKLAPDYVKAERLVIDSEKQLGSVREQIQEEKKKQRTKKPTGIKHLQKEATEIKAKLKELRATRKEAKKKANEDEIIQAAIAASTQTHKDDCKAAEQESGLYWGTRGYLRGTTQSFSSGPPPNFKRYDGSGKCAVQLQNGHECKKVTEPDTRIQLVIPDALHETLYNGTTPSGSQKKAEFLMRVASNGRDPIFARIPIKLHRLLPEGGKIKWAYLERRHLYTDATLYNEDEERLEIDAKHEWTVRLEIELPDSTEVASSDSPYVALRCGWSRHDGGLECLSWVGSDGITGQLTVPIKDLTARERISLLRSRRDEAFNTIRDSFSEWLKANDHPDWMRHDCEHIGKWRSPVKLAGICNRWRAEGGAGDMFDSLDAWRKNDKRQHAEQFYLGRKVTRRHKDRIRVCLKQLQAKYPVAFLPNISVKSLIANAEPEHDDHDESRLHDAARIASPGLIMELAAEYWGINLVKVDSKNINNCSNCGSTQATKPKWQCRACGTTHQRAANVLSNIATRGEVALKNGALLEAVEIKQLANKKRLEKLAKMQAANRAAATARKTRSEALQ